MNLSKRFFIQLIFAGSILFFTACGSDSNPEPTGITQGDPFTDSRDSRQYKTVNVGNKRWMGENLKYESPSAGTSTCYDSNNANCTSLGRLYDFQAANVACPNGWHLPSDQEWKDLESILGIPDSELNTETDRGTDQGTTLINGPFKAEKGGRQTGGVFVGINTEVAYWTSTTDPNDSNSAFSRFVPNGFTTIRRSTPEKDSRYCVRCVEN